MQRLVCGLLVIVSLLLMMFGTCVRFGSWSSIADDIDSLISTVQFYGSWMGLNINTDGVRNVNRAMSDGKLGAKETFTIAWEAGKLIEQALKVDKDTDLIKLKNYSTPASGAKHTTTKAELVNEFSTCIQSVKLITDAMRVGEGDNTGSIVNIEGEFNRFFIIGKGKSYYWEPTTSTTNPPYAPFYNMFEEYSPTSTDSGSQITDFYEKMTQGEIYPVVHDCSTVINFEHYFSMSGKNGTQEKSLTGMFLYIPDNRNSYDERNYNENHQPTTGIYVIELGGKAQDNGDRTYTVTLDWTSKLDEAVGSTVPQNYTLYVYVTDETGNTRVELVNTTETTYSYIVPQDEHSYTITYVVYGEAIANENFNTWSNDATVVIPGWNDFISLTLNHYESDFVKNDGNNYYRNFMGIINDVNAITPENIDAGMNQIVVNRFDAATPEALLPVATITFTNNNGRVNYSVAYQEQNILSGYNLNQINVKSSVREEQIEIPSFLRQSPRR